MLAFDPPRPSPDTTEDPLFARLLAWCEQHPQKLLYRFMDERGIECERHTYASFVDRVRLIAGHLRQDPRLSPGARILLVYPPGLEMICALFGCVAAGCVPVPTPAPAAHSLAASLQRLEGIVRDCEPALILTTAIGSAWLQRAALQAPALAGLAQRTTDDLRGTGDVHAALRPGPLFLLQYTSGSTSLPKGVMVSVANILANCAGVADHASAVAVSWLPQHHDMGLLGYYVYVALSGATTHGFAPTAFVQRPLLWLETISKYRCTASSAPNFAFELCLRQDKVPDAALRDLDLRSLRYLMAAAEPINPEVYRRFLRRFEPCGLARRSLFVAYGLAESTLAVSMYGRTALSVDRQALESGVVRLADRVTLIEGSTQLMSTGRPLEGTSVTIVDPLSGRPCTATQVGEIWVSGTSKCLGYWGKAEASREAFEALPVAAPADTPRYLRTGDMGFLRDGELYVCGRYKDMLIVRGKNVFPQDIELLVEQAHAEARPGSVAAFESGDGIVLVVGVGARGRPDGAAVAATIRRALQLEVRCVTVVRARELPKTTSGKLIRYLARQKWQRQEFTVLAEWRAQSESAVGKDSPKHGFLDAFKARYGLQGDETQSLADVGVASLDLVALLHGLRRELDARGAVADAQVDMNALQSMSIAQLSRLAERAHDPQSSLAALMQSVNTAQRAADAALMRADATRTGPAVTSVAGGACAATPRAILLSGGTGFLGPYLLRSLLARTTANIQVLVRAATPPQAQQRLRAAFAEIAVTAPELLDAFDRRVHALTADLSQERLGLDAPRWRALAEEVDTIYHNGATVNYLHNYAGTRAVNVAGTDELLRLAGEARPKVFNQVSSTFIFGWARDPVLHEADRNATMQLLDFGYAQSKWVAEQRVFEAARRGLPVRVFRPALITPTGAESGGGLDITIRLLSFMIKHGMGVSAANEVSFLPADVTANNIVAIATNVATLGGTFHVTRDDYSNMGDVTAIITACTGRRFEPYSLPDFVPEVIRRCRREDPLYPLLDFLVASVDNIRAMEFKRYDNRAYREARDACPWGLPQTSLHETVSGMLRFMARRGVLDA